MLMLNNSITLQFAVYLESLAGVRFPALRSLNYQVIGAFLKYFTLHLLLLNKSKFLIVTHTYRVRVLAMRYILK